MDCAVERMEDTSSLYTLIVVMLLEKSSFGVQISSEHDIETKVI